MIGSFKQTVRLVQYHWKTLLLFEVLYRLFGLAIIYPVLNRLFSLSISVTGDAFILTRDVVDYAFRPTTIGIGILLLIVFGLYVTFEVAALAVLFHQAKFKQPISLQLLLLSAGSKTYHAIKSYHLTILMSSLTFLVIVEGLHVAGVASTIQIPSLIIEELQETGWFFPVLIASSLLLIWAFFETLFFELQAIVHNKSLQDNIRSSHKLMAGKRLTIVTEFLGLNLILNLMLYLVYIIVIAVVGVVLSLVQESSVAFSIFLTLLYTIYLMVGFVASVILIPVNYAWINTWFFKDETDPSPSMRDTITHMDKIKPFKKRTFERIFGMMNILMIALIIIIFSVGNINSASQIAFIRNPQIVSHRGGGIYAPENTLTAIERGITLGADAIEIDVRFTSDGVPILFHDSTTARTTNDVQDRAIATMPFDIVRTLDAGSWFHELYTGEQVPTLEEALMLIDRRVDVYIELKTGTLDDVETVLTIIEDTNMSSHTKILSFQQSILEKFKANNPDLSTVLLVGAFTGDINQLIAIDYIDYYGIRATVVLDNIELIQILQQGGKGVYVWTVNDFTMIDDINALGVDGIITDRPVLARKIVYEDRTRSGYSKLLERLFQTN
jgi:glycerophosphoryl diester phosphodiesterase